MVEHAALYQTQFEGDRALHVRTPMIDGLGHRQQLFEDAARLGIVLSLAGLDQLNQQLGRDVAITDQQAVDVEHGRQQPFVMAGKNLQLGRGLLDLGDLGVPALHVAYAVLGGDHALLSGDVDLGLQIIGRLGGVRVLEQDALQAGLLPDRLVAVLRRALLEAEPQPAVVRIDQGARRAGGLRGLGLLGGDAGALTRDAGDDRHGAIDRLSIGLDQLQALFDRQEGAFPGMAQDDQALHALDRHQPFGQLRIGGIIDLAIASEDCDGGGAEASQVHDAHDFLSGVSYAYRQIGNDTGIVPTLHPGLAGSSVLAGGVMESEHRHA